MVEIVFDFQVQLWMFFGEVCQYWYQYFVGEVFWYVEVQYVVVMGWVEGFVGFV